MLRLGMVVAATFYGLEKEVHATVPGSAVLHLHDRDYVFVPLEGDRFQHVEVGVGKLLPGTARGGAPRAGAPAPAGRAVAATTPPPQDAGERQEITSGLRPGQQVVVNALALQAAAEQ